MNSLGGDKELSDLLDFSAMFAPPGSMVGKSAATLAESSMSGSLQRTGALEDGSTWQNTVSGYDRGYHTESNHGLYSSIDDVDSEFLARKTSSFSNYLSSNTLASLGKSKDPYTSSYSPGYRDPALGSTQGSGGGGGGNDVSLSGSDWRSRKYKSNKNNGSLPSNKSKKCQSFQATKDDLARASPSCIFLITSNWAIVECFTWGLVSNCPKN